MSGGGHAWQRQLTSQQPGFKEQTEGAGDKMSIGEYPQGPALLSKVLPSKVTFFFSRGSLSNTDPVNGSTYGRDQSPSDPGITAPSVDTAALGAKPSKHSFPTIVREHRVTGWDWGSQHSSWDASAQALGE